jgi:hypothetical protein
MLPHLPYLGIQEADSASNSWEATYLLLMLLYRLTIAQELFPNFLKTVWSCLSY